MKTGTHILADQLSTYGSILEAEENALRATKANLALEEIVKNLSAQLQLIALWISIWKNEKDINIKSFEIKKNCECLLSNKFGAFKLKSKSDTTFREIADNIKGALASYTESINDESKRKVKEESEIGLNAFRARANKFWHEQAKKSPTAHVEVNKNQTADSPKTGTDTAKTPDKSPGINGIKAH